MKSVAPPSHTRSLYASIPLPPDDIDREVEVYPRPRTAVTSIGSLGSSLSSSSTTAPPTPPNPNPIQFSSTKGPHGSTHDPRPIQLHSSLQNACLSSCLSPPRTLGKGSRSPPRPTNWARDREAPATTPSVGCLTLIIDSTGRSICIWPTSHTRPHVVTVGDVMDALDAALITVDEVCRARCGSGRKDTPVCVGEQMSVLLDSLQIWWRTGMTLSSPL
ncbi:hypothetical protein FPV67DRAFT_885510 [Lyophyllum atratum]|nr:hypothetical protein FPV67DRAFT_885510 [Lyophyllum atratum]